MNRQEPLSVIFHGMSDGAPIKAGRLFWQDGCSIFEYDADYLAAGVQLSPLRLEWQAGIQQPERHPFQGLHGVFSDSLPDGWGLLVMDRTLRSMGHDPATLTPLDRLAFLGNLTLGALSYQRESYERESHERESHERESHKRESHKRESPEPDEGSTLASDSGQPIDLHRLGREATGLYEGKEGNLDEVLERHLIHGSSPGGARPKLLVGLAPDGDSLSTITSSTKTSSTKTSSTIKGATIKKCHHKGCHHKGCHQNIFHQNLFHQNLFYQKECHHKECHQNISYQKEVHPIDCHRRGRPAGWLHSLAGEVPHWQQPDAASRNPGGIHLSQDGSGGRHRHDPLPSA